MWRSWSFLRTPNIHRALSEPSCLWPADCSPSVIFNNLVSLAIWLCPRAPGCVIPGRLWQWAMLSFPHRILFPAPLCRQRQGWKFPELFCPEPWVPLGFHVAKKHFWGFPPLPTALSCRAFYLLSPTGLAGFLISFTLLVHLIKFPLSTSVLSIFFFSLKFCI